MRPVSRQSSGYLLQPQVWDLQTPNNHNLNHVVPSTWGWHRYAEFAFRSFWCWPIAGTWHNRRVTPRILQLPPCTRQSWRSYVRWLYATEIPPLMLNTWPVIRLASGEHRNSTACARSSGSVSPRWACETIRSKIFLLNSCFITRS